MDMEKELRNEQENAILAGEAEGGKGNKEARLVVKFKKPYRFEGREYTEIDLSGLEELTSADMISINRIVSRSPRSNAADMMPEVSLEYVCYLAARATKQPVEFFTGLPAKYAMRVKDRVLGFLFGAD